MNNTLYKVLRKLKVLPPKVFLKIHYKQHTGKKLDLENPTEFNEKIQWLKVYYKPPILTDLVDKYKVRQYVKDKVGEQYLNELYGVYDRPGDIDFEALPQQFVIKATHGYDMNIIVQDKDGLDIFETRQRCLEWLSKNRYYRAGLEWAYKNIEPKLIAERYLKEAGREGLNDYKFFCFSGEPKFLKIDVGRGEDHYKCYYDIS